MSDDKRGSQTPYENLLDKWAELREAVKALYFAAYWHADRPVDEAALWTAVRDRAGIEPGQTGKVLGADRSTFTAERQIADFVAAQKDMDPDLAMAARKVCDDMLREAPVVPSAEVLSKKDA